MPTPTASFPTSVWDGTSTKRSSRSIYGAAYAEDYDRVTSEVIAVQRMHHMIPIVATAPTLQPALDLAGWATLVWVTADSKFYLWTGAAWIKSAALA